MEDKRENILKYFENTDNEKKINIVYEICNLENQDLDNIDDRLLDVKNDIKTSLIPLITNNNSSNLILEKIEHLITKNSLSKDKGEMYEKSYLELLEQSLEGYEITKTGNKACDIKVQTENNSILLELKDYKNIVPFTEVEKFHRDLKHNKCSGIMISDKTNISRKKNCDVEELEKGIYCIYLSQNNMNIDNVITSIKFLEKMVEFLNKYESMLSDTIDPKEYEHCLQKLEDYDRFQTLALKNAKNTLDVAEKNYKELISISRSKGIINTAIKEEIEDKVSLCHFCGKYFSNGAGPSSHKKTCSLFPKDDNGKKLLYEKTGRWYTDMTDKYEDCQDCNLSYNIKNTIGTKYHYKDHHYRFFHKNS